MDAAPKARDDAGLAYALLRITLGLNILMHGVSRLLGGAGTFASSMAKTFQNTVLPAAVVLPFAYALPWLEGAVGFLLLIGFRTREALVAGAMLMLALTFGTTLLQDWNVAAIQLLYSAIYAALIAAVRHNILSVDEWLSGAPRSAARQ